MTRRTLVSLGASLPGLQALAGAGKIRVAVIGTGHGHALSKIRALRSMPQYEFVGVHRADASDPAEAEQLKGVRWLSMNEILNDSAIELVAIESADVEQNLKRAQLCVEANKFVHLDKPPGASLEDLRRLFREAEKRKKVVQLGYQWRYHPAMQSAMEAAQKGWLGPVYRFEAAIDKNVGAEERRLLAKFPGGLMFSEGCHLVDRAVALLGRPKKATGFLHHESTLNDGLADNTLAVLEYDRAIAQISLAGFHTHGNRYRYLEIRGMNGSARVEPYTFPSRLTIALAEGAGPYKAGEQVTEVSAPPGLAYTPDFAEMATAIREGAKPSYTAEHDLLTQETLLRVSGMLGS